MPTFEQGDVIRVPFPYTDRDTRQHRPALVVSAGALGDQDRLLWVVMITSAENRRWPGDVELVENHLEVGLPVPSLIRTTKIATIEVDHADRLGSLPAESWVQVSARVGSHLAFS